MTATGFEATSNLIFRDLFESKFITGLYLGDRINLLSSIRYQFIFNDTEEWGGEPNIRGFNKDDISGHQILLLNQELRAEFFYKEDIGRVALTAFWDGALSGSYTQESMNWHNSVGAGFRFYPDFVGGLIFRFEVAVNLQQLLDSRKTLEPIYSLTFFEMLY